MKTRLWMMGLVALAVAVTGCDDTTGEGDPQTIRETGYLGCQDGGGDCPGGFLCETEENLTECVGFPDDCNALTCECVGEEICGDRGCREEDGGVVCAFPEPVRCDSNLDCADNEYCDECVGSSCPECDDCIPGCVIHNCESEPEAACDEPRRDCGSNAVVIRDGCWLCVDARTCTPVEQPFDPCAGKVCGDTCSLCPPDEPECNETGEEKACNQNGQCVSSTLGMCEGEIIPPCESDLDCTVDTVCDQCATSSCPECDDCIAGCLPHGCETEPEPACDQERPECGQEGVAVVSGGCWECVNARSCDPIDNGMVCEDTPEELSCGEGELCCVDRCCGGGEQCCAGIPVPDGEGLCMPSNQPCPMSLRSVKKNIHYITEAEAAGYSEQLQKIRLTTWHYKSEPSEGQKHLGFIIDDAPGPHTVAADGKHVDLYGYTSLTVATLQVQAKQIEAMKAEMKALREEIAAMKAAKR